ncbi:helix-turn-helix domain-containing protein [Mycobacterium simulans]|uniref:helix-turn-helix domain-containing protein n=1 Tax=Mycobacterium simulans TaxID=627089 RepID=UPI00174A471E|nr:helix-turn-helix domain-containing protein [Mycobacterium simulans]
MARYTPPGKYKKPQGRLLSTAQAAEYLGISVRTLFNYRQAGKLSAYRVGEKLWKYDPADLENFVSKKASA